MRNILKKTTPWILALQLIAAPSYGDDASAPATAPAATDQSTPVAAPAATDQSTPVAAPATTDQSTPVAAPAATDQSAPTTDQATSDQSTPVAAPAATDQSAPVDNTPAAARPAPAVYSISCAPPSCPQPPLPKQVCPSCASSCCPPWYVPVLNAAYNYPARIETRSSWDLSVDLSFIYWQPIQENMELGIQEKAKELTATSYKIPLHMINMNFDYKPGFKIGLGFDLDYDHWDIRAEYTWFHNQQNKRYFDPHFVSGCNLLHIVNTIVCGGILPMWGSPSLFPQGTNSIGTPGAAAVNVASDMVFQEVSEKWKLGIDLIDIDVGRWYYVGQKLNFRPSVGARGAFIHQQVHVSYLNGYNAQATAAVAPLTGYNAQIHAQSHSWGVGPRVALATDWAIDYGFRLFGKGEADVLYTRYTKLHESESANRAPPALTPFGVLPPDAVVKQNRLGTLRTHLDLELGFGWGTYFDCNNWYLDFSAGYEFQVFFDQNMFRHFSTSNAAAFSFSPNGNLYIQGLTLTAKLDF